MYFIDCPNGFRFNKIFAKLLSFWLSYFKNRDLALVYKDLRNILSKYQIMRLYKVYAKITNNYLSKESKLKIINHFKNTNS